MSQRRWTAMAAACACASVMACERAPAEAPKPNAEPAAAAEKAPAASVDVDDPQACAPCHGAVVSEWNESMHRRSHHDEDPIYGAMRALRMKKQGAEVAQGCADCHTPRAMGDDTTPAARAGVSCATCHAIEAVRTGEGHGARALTWARDGVMRSARDLAPGASPVHGTGPRLEAIANGETLCLTCHDMVKTPAGVVACSTGPERQEGGEGQTCVECHMPEVDGPAGSVGGRQSHRSHAFMGPHRAWYQDDPSMLEGAGAVTASLRDGVVTVDLKNESAHNFPTGFPGRYAVVRVRALDASGAELWSNLAGGPRAAGEGAFLGKVYHDADGKPVPAAFATTLASDTRLATKAPRTVTVEVGEVGRAAQVEVALLYGLLPAPLAKKLGLEDAPEAKPKVIWSQTLTP